MTGLCLSRRTVLDTYHARMFSAWFELLHFRTRALFLVCPPATPLHLHVFGFGACQDFWMSSLFPKYSGQNSWIQRVSKFGNLLNMSMMSRTGQISSPVLNLNRGTHAHRFDQTCIQSSVRQRRRAPVKGSRLSRRGYGRINRIK